MCLPSECLALLVQWVANQRVQDLYPLMCVNKALFYHVVPHLYKDPFSLAARWVWKRSLYRGVIERQTKLIRTLLLCCTRTIAKTIPPPCCCNGITTIVTNDGSPFDSSSYDKNIHDNSLVKPLPSDSAFVCSDTDHYYNVDDEDYHEKNIGTGTCKSCDRRNSVNEPRTEGSSSIRGARDARETVEATEDLDPLTMDIIQEEAIANIHFQQSQDPQSMPHEKSFSSDTANIHFESNIDTIPSKSTSSNMDNNKTRAKFRTSILSRLRPPVAKLSHIPGTLHEQEYHHDDMHSHSHQHQNQHQHAHIHHPRNIKVEYHPIIWDAENERPETRLIPGLEQPLCFPPDLAKTVLRLQNEPPPMTNYLAHVAHNEVRSWSAALNLTTVHRILGGVRPSWQIRLQMFLKRLPRRIIGQNNRGNNLGARGATAGGGNTNGNGSVGMSRYLQDDFEGWDEDEDDVIGISSHGRRRWRGHGGRHKRNKNLWTTRDVDFLELLLLFYTSSRMESLSLGMTCSHWYHPSLDFLVPGVPERLSGLRRIVIDHADSVLHSTTSVPQLFIVRHQAAFPGQLREIQIRQSYHYSYDMSKSVLEIIQTIERLEVLDLSIWTNVFTGLDTIRTTHLRKLLICHHMEVVQIDMFDKLLERCLLLEELSIIVPHPKLFKWAVERKRYRDAAIRGALAATASFTTGRGSSSFDKAMAQEPSELKGLLNQRKVTRWSGGAQDLPPLKIVTLFGQTPDIVEAFKDVVLAFQESLESVHVSMYPDLNKQSSNHFEVPPPHFMVTEDMTPPAFFGMNILPDTMEDFGTATTQTQWNQHDWALAQPGLTVGNALDLAMAASHPSPPSTPSTPSSSSSMSSTTSSLPPLGPSAILSWDWTLPKLRTMSLRGPLVRHFDLGLIRRCPQMTDLALSLHCSRLPRLVFPRHMLNRAAASWAPLPEEVLMSPRSTGSQTSGSSSSTTSTPTRFPKVTICDSLAFKWGMTLNEDRRSLVII
ncbi:hypothetical protein BG000_006732 [Podila horticola]|nr:hypothetical protein BG000_006732 [Podila horticola]